MRERKKSSKRDGRYPATEEELTKTKLWAKSLDLNEQTWNGALASAQEALQKTIRAEANYREWRAQWLRLLLTIGAHLLRDEEEMEEFRQYCKRGGIRYDKNASVFAVISRALYGKDRSNAYVDSLICRQAVVMGLSPEELEEGVSEGSLIPTTMAAEFRDSYIGLTPRRAKKGSNNGVGDSSDAQGDDSGKTPLGGNPGTTIGYGVTGGVLRIAVSMDQEQQQKLARYTHTQRSGIRVLLNLSRKERPQIERISADRVEPRPPRVRRFTRRKAEDLSSVEASDGIRTIRRFPRRQSRW